MNIGVDIGGSHVGVGLVNEEGNIILKKERDLNSKDKKDINNVITNTIVEYINEILSKKNIKIKDIGKIGIASPGTIKNGCITNAVNLGIEKFCIVEELYKYFNNLISIKNDAKCAGIAENLYGSMKGYSDAIFLCLGTGIGGAVFINNKLIEPKLAPGLEFGHMIIEKDGIKCNCGKQGCFEKYASMRALKDMVKKELNLSKEPAPEELLQIIKTEKQITKQYIKYLAIGISNLINIFEPEVISIGGSFAYYKDILLKPLIQEIQTQNLLFNKRETLNIVLATLKNDAGIIGAAN